MMDLSSDSHPRSVDLTRSDDDPKMHKCETVSLPRESNGEEEGGRIVTHEDFEEIRQYRAMQQLVHVGARGFRVSDVRDGME